MKGILLAGGSATRLYPLSSYISKQLLPVYDKPVIYYPLSILMLAGIREILIISTEQDLPLIRKLLKDGSHLGLHLQYCVQEKPQGIAQAFILGENFIEDENICLILGDNLFFGQNLQEQLFSLNSTINGGVIFAYHVSNPQEFGIVEFDDEFNVLSIEEKPKIPKSSWAIPGLYFYDNQVIRIAKTLKPSQRGELEITDINKAYLEQGKLKVNLMSRGTAWLDLGTFENLLNASSFIHILEKRQGLKVACIEEIAYRMGYISREDLKILSSHFPENPYKKYLELILKESSPSRS